MKIKIGPFILALSAAIYTYNGLFKEDIYKIQRERRARTYLETLIRDPSISLEKKVLAVRDSTLKIFPERKDLSEEITRIERKYYTLKKIQEEAYTTDTDKKDNIKRDLEILLKRWDKNYGFLRIIGSMGVGIVVYSIF